VCESVVVVHLLPNCLAAQDLSQKVLEEVATLSARPRPVLQLLKRKPKSIKFYEPQFDEVYE